MTKKIDFKKTFDKLNHLSKQSIADKIRVSWQQVYNWYTGKSIPTQKNSDDLIELFKSNNIEPEYFDE